MNGERQTRARAIALGVLVSAGFLFLVSQLFYLQLIKGWEYKRQAREVARRVLPIPAQRGEIFDRNNDFPLVVNQDSFAVDLVPAEVPADSRKQLFARLADVLGLSLEEVNRKVPARYYHLYQPIEIRGGVSFDTIAFLAEHLLDFPGITWHNKPIRNYLTPGSLAHLIGYVGDITREELQVLFNRGYSFGSVLGKSGIEKQYDLELRGRDGQRFQLVDVREKYLGKRPEEDVPPEPGRNLVLTIDRHIQVLGEKALGSRIGSVVVLKPATGEVLALVSYPSFDPNILFTDRAAAEFNRLSLDPQFPFLNRAIQSVYPPASAFKMVVGTALVEEEAFPLSRKVVCTGQIAYGDRVFRCHARKTGHGALDFFGGLAQSCDVYFYTVGDVLGVERLSYYARDFGLGQPTGIDLPGEVGGFVPTPEWKEKVHHMKWLGGDTLNMSIGQGFLAISPLQMANIVALIANEGRVYRPHVLAQVRDAMSGAVLRSVEPELLHTSAIRPDSFRTVQQAMRRVVTEGTANVVITTKATEVAGKTGTGEAGYEDRWHSWFAAYAPFTTDRPEERVVVVVMVEAENEWEWWAPKAADVIFQGIFAHQSFEEAVETLRPWWYLEERRRARVATSEENQ